MLKHWWKVLCVVILSYVIIAGMLFQFPDLPILKETIRNVFYHVPMWYVMIMCFLISGFNAVAFLLNSKEIFDIRSSQYVFVGIFFGFLGLFTGMEWAKFTWGEAWSTPPDPKQFGAALCLMSYLAYILLRMFVKDDDMKKRLSSVYNIIALAMLFPLLFIIPSRAAGSLHPGAGNNFEALYTQSKYLRIVTLPGLVGWILLGVWITSLKIRLKKVEIKRQELDSLKLDYE